MTRKHYTLVAAALREAKPAAFDQANEAYETYAATMTIWEDTVNRIGYALAGDNPRFDRDRFEVAAGMRES